jgi:thiol-disulfide isomerase/thioredoxin
MSLRKPLTTLLFLTVTGVLFISCSDSARPVGIADRPIAVNGVQVLDSERPPRKPLPEMTWTNFDGVVEKLKEYEGKVVILDFWATYCKPCLEAIPHLKKLQEIYGRDNIAIIGLHVGGPEDRDKVPDFVTKLDIDYTLALPEDFLSQYIFGADSAIPQTAVIGRDGKLVRKFVGFDDVIQIELDKVVAAAIASKAE